MPADRADTGRVLCRAVVPFGAASAGLAGGRLLGGRLGGRCLLGDCLRRGSLARRRRGGRLAGHGLLGRRCLGGGRLGGRRLASACGRLRPAPSCAAVVALAVVALAVVVRDVVLAATLAVVLRAAAGALPLATISLKPAPARNAGTDVFFTFTASPVRGLRAIRAARTRFSKTPNPVMETLSPLVTAVWISASTASSAAVAVFFSPRRTASASMSSALFTSSLPYTNDDHLAAILRARYALCTKESNIRGANIFRCVATGTGYLVTPKVNVRREERTPARPRTAAISPSVRRVNAMSSRPSSRRDPARNRRAGTARIASSDANCPVSPRRRSLSWPDSLSTIDHSVSTASGGNVDREQSFLESVAAEDVAEPRRDDGPEPVVPQGPDGVFARRADAELGARRPGSRRRRTPASFSTKSGSLSRQARNRPSSKPVRVIRLRYSAGMIWSVSTSERRSGTCGAGVHGELLHC